jgi:hypothetical protein
MKARAKRTETKERAATRTNQLARLKRACAALKELAEQHGLQEDHAIYSLEAKLTHAIRFQHIADPDYAEYKRQQAAKAIPTGDF